MFWLIFVCVWLCGCTHVYIQNVLFVRYSHWFHTIFRNVKIIWVQNRVYWFVFMSAFWTLDILHSWKSRKCIIIIIIILMLILIFILILINQKKIPAPIMRSQCTCNIVADFPYILPKLVSTLQHHC